MHLLKISTDLLFSPVTNNLLYQEPIKTKQDCFDGVFTVHNRNPLHSKLGTSSSVIDLPSLLSLWMHGNQNQSSLFGKRKASVELRMINSSKLLVNFQSSITIGRLKGYWLSGQWNFCLQRMTLIGGRWSLFFSFFRYGSLFAFEDRCLSCRSRDFGYETNRFSRQWSNWWGQSTCGIDCGRGS